MDICSLCLLCATAIVCVRLAFPERNRHRCNECDCDDDPNVAEFRVGEKVAITASGKEDTIYGCWNIKGKGFVYALDNHRNVEFRESDLEPYDD